MNTALCTTGCGRPATGMCSHCWSSLDTALRTLYADGRPGWLLAELDVALTRQHRFGPVQSSGPSRLSEQPLVVNLAASDSLAQLRRHLARWTVKLHDEHAVRWHECSVCRAHWYDGAQRHDVMPPRLCPGEWQERVDPLTVGLDIVDLAGWMLRHPSWIRADQRANQLHRSITFLVAAAIRLIDRPPDLTYIGICSAPSRDEHGNLVVDESGVLVECPIPLYAKTGELVTRCWGCGADHVVQDRLRVLARAVENELAPVSALVGLVGELGTVLTSSSIRGMKARGRLHPMVRDDQGYLRLRTAADEGPDLFRVGDVLDLLPKLRPRREAKASSA